MDLLIENKYYILINNYNNDYLIKLYYVIN